MNNVIKLDNYRDAWKKVFSDCEGRATVDMYINKLNGEVELLVYNDEGECINKVFAPVTMVRMLTLLQQAYEEL